MWGAGAFFRFARRADFGPGGALLRAALPVCAAVPSGAAVRGDATGGLPGGCLDVRVESDSVNRAGKSQRSENEGSRKRKRLASGCRFHDIAVLD